MLIVISVGKWLIVFVSRLNFGDVFCDLVFSRSGCCCVFGGNGLGGLLVCMLMVS